MAERASFTAKGAAPAEKPLSEKLRTARQIDEARQRNALYGQAGSVRLQQQYHFRDKSVQDKRWRRLPGFRNISVGSGAKKWKALSPLYLGPVSHAEEDSAGALAPAGSLDNLWRYSQVFAEDVGKDGEPNEAWLQRRRLGFALPKGERQVRGSKRRSNEAPLFWYWRGQHLDAVTARKEIYCHLYAALVVDCDLYRELDLMVQQGFNIQLFGYEAYDFVEESKTLLQAIEDPQGSFGHEFVLYGLLTRDAAWTR